MKNFILTLFFLLISIPIYGAKFKLIDTWNHGTQIFGNVRASVIDKNGNLIVAFYKNGVYLISKENLSLFTTIGEGPGEIMGFWALTNYGDDIGILERSDKLQVYTQTGKSYKWKETLWFKRGPYPHIVTNVIFADGKWFFSGHFSQNYNPKIFKLCYLKAYGQDRKELKAFLGEERSEKKQDHLMSFYIASNKDKVFFLPENNFQLSVISIKNVSIERTIPLQTPPFYKKMPSDFYRHKDRNEYRNLEKEFLEDIENWQLGYSRITKILVDGDKLALSIRTCDKKMKKFCLLFYNIETLKLENQILTDDYLLGSKDGKFYFYADGNPSLDEDIDKCVIKIYQFEDVK